MHNVKKKQFKRIPKFLKIKTLWTSGQDGGIGTHTLPPRTTVRGIITNFKTKDDHKCQKTKLYGSLTTKDLKKKYSSRWIGGAELGSWGREDMVWQW